MMQWMCEFCPISCQEIYVTYKRKQDFRSIVRSSKKDKSVSRTDFLKILCEREILITCYLNKNLLFLCKIQIKAALLTNPKNGDAP